MSNLTNVLDRMLFWVNSYLPQYAQSFQPGLAFHSIREKFRDINYILPDDFYELYQWRNGSPDESLRSLGPVFHFLPLEDVLEYKDWIMPNTLGHNSLVTHPSYKDCPILPFIKANCEYYGLIVGLDYESNAYIAMLDEVGDSTLAYDSITSLMDSIATCFETQAYYLDSDGFIAENEQLAAQVLREKNPKVISEATNSLQREINSSIYNQSISRGDFSNHAKLLHRSLETLKPFRPPAVIEVLQETLAYLEQNRVSERERHIYLMLRRWLADVEAI